MSSGRKTYDGNVFGRNDSSAQRRDTFNSEGTSNRNASKARTRRDAKFSNIEDNLFSEDEGKDRYLITYSDLITLLLGLFIILYAMSTIDLAKYQSAVNEMGTIFGGSGLLGGANVVNPAKEEDKIVLTDIQKLKNELSGLITSQNYGASISLEENERGITLHILDDILFPSGSADLTEGSKDVLNKIADIIKKLPNDIRVEGHTDDLPIHNSLYPSNWHLSVARALNTAYYLINERGLNPDKVSIVGYSEYKPIAHDDTEESRAKNRRVDFVIIKQ